MIDRRRFLLRSTAAGAIAGAIVRSVPAEDKKRPVNRELVSKFVGRCHFDFESVQKMLEREPGLLNSSWDWGAGDWETGLGAAAHTGRSEIALHLLAKGARIDVFAATMLGYESIVRVFLDEMPLIHEVPGPHGIPLLSHAVFGRQTGLVEALLDRGAAIDAASFLGMTPLMAAASIGHMESLELLLNRGANPRLKDGENRTALRWAEARKHQNAIARLRQL